MDCTWQPDLRMLRFGRIDLAQLQLLTAVLPSSCSNAALLVSSILLRPRRFHDVAAMALTILTALYCPGRLGRA